MVSGTLAPLYTVFGLKLGCSGAAAPIGDKVLQNGEIFHSSVHLFIHPSTSVLPRAPRASQAGLKPISPAKPIQPGLRGSKAWLAGCRGSLPLKRQGEGGHRLPLLSALLLQETEKWHCDSLPFPAPFFCRKGGPNGYLLPVKYLIYISIFFTCYP